MLDLLIIGIRGRIKQKNTVYLYKCGYEYRPIVDYGIHCRFIERSRKNEADDCKCWLKFTCMKI